MGDPGSPLAFLLYLADFATPAHPDDVVLDGVPISHLEHADDMVLLSTSPEGLQSKLDALGTWSSQNQMEISARKTVVMIFNRPRTTVPAPATPFKVYELPLEIVKEVRYVGVWFCTNSSNLWDCHFTKAAQKVRRAANVAFFIESYTGPIPPWQGRALYATQVDPHLIWGTAVTGLGTLAQQGRLEAVQLAFLRPDLRHNLYNAPVDLPLQWTEESTSTCLSKLKESMLTTIDSQVTASPKLDLIQYRGYLDAWGRRRSPVLMFRPYLKVSEKALRDAITRTLLSDHRLAIELLRRKSPERQYRNPRRAWVSRLCLNSVETPLHAIFDCSASVELLEYREAFWERCSQIIQLAEAGASDSRSRKHSIRFPSLIALRSMLPLQALHVLIENEETATALGSFTVRVFSVYDATPLYIPNREPGWEDDEDGEN